MSGVDQGRVPEGTGLSQAEEWRAVVGYEGIYEVSDLGRVRSRHAVNGHVLSPTSDKDGYPVINLYAPDGRRTWAVHRLVASAFHGEKRNALHREVAHLDGDKTNARADNLKWCSKIENHHHKRAHGTHQAGEKHPRAKLTNEAVEEIRESRGLRGALAAKYGISKDTVTDIRRGRRWS